MDNNPNHIGLLDDTLLPREFKVKMYNAIALGTLCITIIYSILNLMLGDSIMVVVSHSFYMFTAILILTSNAWKQYELAEITLSILFPLCFLGSSIALGAAYHTEHYIFITGVGSIFIFNKRKVVITFLIYNFIIFLLIKLFFHHFPNPIFKLNQNALITHFFNASNGFIVLTFLISITIAVRKKNRSLYVELNQIQQNQDKIILERTNQLEKTNEEINRFTHISAHDLREPLRNIMSFSQLLEKDITLGKKENNIEYLEYIKQNTIRIDTITRDIVYYTEIDNRSKRVEIVDCSEVVQDIFNYYKEQEDNLDLSFDNLPKIKVNRNLCYDLFSQLIQNAITYSDKIYKKITISCSLTDSNYLFSIKDNGNGIPEEFIDSTFVMFKRLHNNLNHKGSGIGLSICKKIINSYDGTIWAKSNLKKGSTFYFTFPISNSNDKTEINSPINKEEIKVNHYQEVN